MFENVNKAYEFLCTKSARIVDGPDPENIILILKAQSILFNRHREGLVPSILGCTALCLCPTSIVSLYSTIKYNTITVFFL